MSESNQKGDIGEAAFVLAATKRGYWVMPAPQDCPYDFVLDKHDGKLYRVQVKYRTPGKVGSIAIKRVTHKEHCAANRRTYTADNVDLFAVYIPEPEGVYLIPITDFDTVDEVTIRVTPPKNNQTAGVRLITEYADW